MYVHVLLVQNICLLTYFQIKIPAYVDEAENILHVFYKHCFFLGQHQYAYGFS